VNEWSDGIRRRVESASRGPWSLNRDPLSGMLLIHNAEGELVSGKADAAFIVKAREDVPRLLAELERYRTDSEQARATLTAIREWAEEVMRWTQEPVSDGLSAEEGRAEYKANLFLGYAAKRILDFLENGTGAVEAPPSDLSDEGEERAREQG
jgi:hypothetical protein